MTTLVTGGTGFLGRHLVDRLLERGEDVRVLTRSFDRDLSERGVEIAEGSLNDAADVHRALEGVERVYHLAGKVDRRPGHAHEMYEIHVEGTRRVLGAAAEQDVEKVVVASTSGTVGVSDDPNYVATEDSPTTEKFVRNWPYYLSKIYTERVCQKYIDDRDLSVVVMRPTLLLGPGDHRGSSTEDVVRFLKGEIPAAMPGGISFVDARDAADAFIAAMEKAEDGETFLLGQQNLPLQEFFERLEEISGVRAPKLPVPGRLAVAGTRVLESALRAIGKKPPVDSISVEMAQHYWYIDSSKAREELDWRPRSPEETLRDTVRWIRKNHPDFETDEARPTPPEEFVPRETVEFAKKMFRDDD